MNDYTSQLLRTIENAPHDDFVSAYILELEKSCAELYELRALITSPWYDRFLTQKRVGQLKLNIASRWPYLEICMELINWSRVNDRSLIESAELLQEYHFELSSYPLIAKLFTA